MSDIFHILHVLVAIGLIGLVLIQHGKGADAGAAFGSGASSTVFGSQGSASFLSRTTAILAALFFLSSLVLAYFSTQKTTVKSIMDTAPAQTAPAPASELPPTLTPTAPAAKVPANNGDVPAIQPGAATVPATAPAMPAVSVETQTVEQPAKSLDAPVLPATPAVPTAPSNK